MVKSCIVSVIMPLYNASAYLAESLDSILTQTFTDFELICINDASEDDTYRIVDSYRQKDNRIKLYSNEQRKGAAYSRNKGIELSAGEFLLFLDGDDLYERDLIELCYSSAVYNGVDIVFYNYGHFDNSTIQETAYAGKDNEYYLKHARRPFAFYEYVEPEMVYMLLATCNKFYKREFIVGNSIRFQDLPRQNDVKFSLLALLTSNNVIALEDDRLMVRARDHDQLSRLTNTNNPFCIYNAINELIKELSNRNLVSRAIPKFYYVFLDLIIDMIKKADYDQGERYYSFLRDEGLKELDELCCISNYHFGDYAVLRGNCFQFDYASLWWNHREPEWIECVLGLLRQPIIDYFETIANEYPGIIVWGCGDIGTRVIRYFKEYGVPIRMITDKNPQTTNRIIWGYCVSDLSELVDDGVYIITTSRKIDITEIEKNYSNAKVTSIYAVLSEIIKKKAQGGTIHE